MGSTQKPKNQPQWHDLAPHLQRQGMSWSWELPLMLHGQPTTLQHLSPTHMPSWPTPDRMVVFTPMISPHLCQRLIQAARAQHPQSPKLECTIARPTLISRLARQHVSRINLLIPTDNQAAQRHFVATVADSLGHAMTLIRLAHDEGLQVTATLVGDWSANVDDFLRLRDAGIHRWRLWEAPTPWKKCYHALQTWGGFVPLSSVSLVTSRPNIALAARLQGVGSIIPLATYRTCTPHH